MGKVARRIAEQRPCQAAQCDRPAWARGLCDMHYHRLRRAGLPFSMAAADRGCSVPGCPRPHRARGLCNTHRMAQARGAKLTIVCRAAYCGLTARARGFCLPHYKLEMARLERGGCSIVDCTGTHYGRGLCRKHWERDRRTGAPAEFRHQPRLFPLEPLERLAPALRATVRASSAAIAIARQEGLTVAQADTWANRAGYHPAEVWGDLWHQAAA